MKGKRTRLILAYLAVWLRGLVIRLLQQSRPPTTKGNPAAAEGRPTPR
jgi:hypothetical protein